MIALLVLSAAYPCRKLDLHKSACDSAERAAAAGEVEQSGMDDRLREMFGVAAPLRESRFEKARQRLVDDEFIVRRVIDPNWIVPLSSFTPNVMIERGGPYSYIGWLSDGRFVVEARSDRIEQVARWALTFPPSIDRYSAHIR